MTDDVVQGTIEAGFEGVRAAFAGAFDGRPGMGAGLSVWRQGRPIVDLWGGTADRRSSRPWSADTPSVMFSCTKGVTSLIAARLVELGEIAYDDPLVRYWPEFAQSGKDSITIAQALSHRAGLSAPSIDLTRDDLLDWTRVTQLMAEQEPIWPPGETYAYHAVTHGWLIGEVVRRVSGQSIGSYLRDQIAGPLAADVWIGIPASEEQRVAHLSVEPPLAAVAQQLERSQRPDRIDLVYRAMTLGGALPISLVTETGGFNDPALHQAEIPGGGGIGSARGLAKLYSAAVTPTDGVRLLSEATIAQATVLQSTGEPFTKEPAPWHRWAMGFQLDSPARPLLSANSFGHDGAGGQVAFADPDHEVGFAFITNALDFGDSRGDRIIAALRTALHSAREAS